jgi:hypothetical protein
VDSQELNFQITTIQDMFPNKFSKQQLEALLREQGFDQTFDNLLKFIDENEDFQNEDSEPEVETADT